MTTQNQIGQVTQSYPHDLPRGYLYYGISPFTSTPVTVSTTYVSVSATYGSGFNLINAKDFDEPSDGRLRYIGSTTAKFLVTASFNTLVAAGDGIAMAIYKNGSIVSNTENYSVAGGGGPSSFRLATSNFEITLANNDYLEVFVKRNSSGSIYLQGCTLSAVLYCT